MAGMTLAGLLAARITWDLSCRPLHLLDREAGWALDRTGATRAAVTIPVDADAIAPLNQADPARLAGVRIAAAAVAGPIMAIGGAVAGTTVGWLIAREMLGVPSPIFFEKGFEMLWSRDVYGLLAKGSAFGAAAALLACYEGLRRPADPETLPNRAARAACLSALVILMINGSWYLLMYMAGPAFGPTVLPPPVP
jgi:phospholipid/cholesterol/gamma-HCH transport system permease protein